MRPVDLSSDVIPIARFKTQASALLRRMHRQDRPLVITQRGAPSAVLMTPEDFEALTASARVVAKILRGLESRHARTFSADEVRASAKRAARARGHAG